MSIAGRAANRVLATVPVLLGAVVFTFLLTHVLPGDPAAFLASGPSAGPEEIAQIRARMGLDQPLAVQLQHYLYALVHGDWGQSHMTGQPVLTDLWQRLPATLELTFAAFALTLAVALPLGAAAALRPRSIWDRACTLLTVGGSCMPSFVIALLLIYVFYFLLGWSPEPTGRIDAMLAPPPQVTGFMFVDALLAWRWDALGSAAGRLLLPSVAMAFFSLAPVARLTRASLLGVLRSDPVRTARALGLPPRAALANALHLALLPVVTSAGMVFSYMLSANVVIEKVFAWPGIGSYALDALMAADHAPLQGFVLLVALLFVFVNLLVDVLHGRIDPRAGAGA
ncbi:ABC transporter permease [Variovorax sp. 770b2]|uniref:ABC transporter permease n=1 Tax=Variovorax sp. 770b2 TaxID=1566271 RepID=UPI0008E3F78A|nr:ABC transporter permease [Variovorax sp. 770b2]SFQ34920.1 peptide/nickel transport system permease protein [Variovorax sp. 770b2]